MLEAIEKGIWEHIKVKITDAILIEGVVMALTKYTDSRYREGDLNVAPADPNSPACSSHFPIWPRTGMTSSFRSFDPAEISPALSAHCGCNCFHGFSPAGSPAE
jgi:hypothetical protein